MLGQFYHGCPQAGVHNPRFRPLSTPYPLFAVRYMVKDDELFNRDVNAQIEYRKYFP